MFPLSRLGRGPAIRPVHERWRRLAAAYRLSAPARARLEWFVWHDTHGRDVALT